jgi:hypothetical protein
MEDRIDAGVNVESEARDESALCRSGEDGEIAVMVETFKDSAMG